MAIRSWKRRRILSLRCITKEEEQFNKTIDQGLSILAGDGGRDGEKRREGTCPERNAFRLYDTYGFPAGSDQRDFGRKRYADVDEEGFQAAWKAQRKTARDAHESVTIVTCGADATVYESDRSVCNKLGL